MASPTIRADFDQLRDIAQRWDAHADVVQNATADVRARMDQLASGDWQGAAAVRFLGEMDGAVLPAMNRLHASLRSAAETTRRIAQQMQGAEQAAASTLDGRAAAASMTGGQSAASAGAGAATAVDASNTGTGADAGAAGFGGVGGGGSAGAGGAAASLPGGAGASPGGAGAIPLAGNAGADSGVAGTIFGAAGTAGAAGSLRAAAGAAAVGGAGGIAGIAGLGMMGGMLGKSSNGGDDELAVGGGSTAGPSARLGDEVASAPAGSAADAANGFTGSLQAGKHEAVGAGGWSDAAKQAAAEVLRNPVDPRTETALRALAQDAPSSVVVDDALKALAASSGRSLADLRTDWQHVVDLRQRALLSGALGVPGAGEIGVRLQERLSAAVLVGDSLGVDARLAALLIPFADVPSGVDPAALLTQASDGAARCAGALRAMRGG
jgi:WXG100 family type VII secretion target